MRIESRTPSATIQYTRNEGTYTATNRNWTTADGPNTNNTTNNLPSRPGDPATNATSPINLQIGNANHGGYQWWVRARAVVGSTNSTETEEVAYRTAITYRLQGRGGTNPEPSPGNPSGDYREIAAGAGESRLANGDQIWIRGGDAIGSSSIPGFPFTWEDKWNTLAKRTQPSSGLRRLRERERERGSTPPLFFI